MVKKEDFEASAKTLDIRGLFISAIVTALAFVVGLFWNDAIKSTIELVIPSGGGKLYYKYIAAIVVTVSVSIVAYLLYRSQAIKTRDVVRLVEKERLIALDRFTKTREFLKLPHWQKERIKREIKKGK